jgi:hypothetical protein
LVVDKIMAMWGQYYVGIRYPMREEDTLVAGKIYEARYTTPIDIPDNLELPLIRELIKYREHGAEPTFVYVKRRTVIVQWYQRMASPITAWAVVTGLALLAVAILAFALMMVSISRVEGIPATFGIPTSLIMAGFGFLMIILVLVLIVLPVLRAPKPERPIIVGGGG